MRKTWWHACAAILLLQGLVGGSGRAQQVEELGNRGAGQVSQHVIDDANPEASVPDAKRRDGNPLEYGYFIQDLLARAEAAHKAHDYQAEVRYYRAVAKAVPDRAKGWSKLCEAYETVRDRERAIRSCKYAIDREGAELQDYSRYVSLILGREGNLLPEDRTRLEEALDHLDKDPALATAAAHLRCQVGVRDNDAAALQTCTAVLAAQAPEDPRTLVFQWSLAMLKGNSSEAARLLGRVRKTGTVLEDNILRMEKMTNAAQRRVWPIVAGAGGLLLIASAVLVLVRRRTTSRTLARSV